MLAAKAALREEVWAALAVPAWAWLLLFFVAPVAMVVWFSFGYKPGIFGTHANDILSFDRYVEAVSPTFFATFQNTLWVGILGTVLCFLIGAPDGASAVLLPPSFDKVVDAIMQRFS